MEPCFQAKSSDSSDKDKGIPVRGELRLPPPPKPDDPDYERKYAIYQQILQVFMQMAELAKSDGIDIKTLGKTHDNE